MVLGANPQPICWTLSMGQSITHKDISSGGDERSNSMDVIVIPISYGRSGPSINNHSKSIYKNWWKSRQLRKSFDIIQGLNELFN